MLQCICESYPTQCLSDNPYMLCRSQNAFATVKDPKIFCESQRSYNAYLIVKAFTVFVSVKEPFMSL